MKTQISEETAKGLIKAFEQFASSTAFAKNQMEDQMKELLKKQLELIENKLNLQYLNLNLNVKKASFITRWYWVKQLEKHTIKMKAFSELQQHER